MAIATLAKVVHNRDVFTGVVKIRKGQALKLLVENGDMEVRAGCTVNTAFTKPHVSALSSHVQSVYKTFAEYTRVIAAAIPRRHTAAHAIATEAASTIHRLCDVAVSTTATSSVELKKHHLQLRAAAFCCPIIGFVVQAIFSSGETSPSSVFSALLNIVLFIFVFGAVYYFFAAARTPRELSLPGRSMTSIRASAVPGRRTFGIPLSAAPATVQSSANDSAGVELGY